jgi:hypothetical protein
MVKDDPWNPRSLVPHEHYKDFSLWTMIILSVSMANEILNIKKNV